MKRQLMGESNSYICMKQSKFGESYRGESEFATAHSKKIFHYFLALSATFDPINFSLKMASADTARIIVGSIGMYHLQKISQVHALNILFSLPSSLFGIR